MIFILRVGVIVGICLFIAPVAAIAEDAGTGSPSNATFCTDCGFGPALVWAKFRKDNISAASTHGAAGGPVRIDDSSNSQIALWVEAHVWVTDLFGVKLSKDNFGVGPFVAVQVTSNNAGSSGQLFNSFGLGLMIGSRTKATSNQSTKSNTSWNIGLGMASTTIQSLGDGLTANQPLPAGVSDVFYKKERVYAPFVIFSWAFE